MFAEHKARAIRELNDTLRMYGEGGETVYSEGFQHLDRDAQAQAISAIRATDSFDDDEHASGTVTIGDWMNEQSISWEIEYRDASNANFESSNPADPAETARILTIKLAGE